MASSIDYFSESPLAEISSAQGISTDRTSTMPEEQEKHCVIFAIVVNFFINGSLCIVGLIGNGLTCVIMWPEHKKSATAFLLVCLAVIDGLVLTVWTTMRVLHTIAFLAPEGMIAYHLQYFIEYGWATGSFVHLSASLVVTLVTLQRYISVCHPHNAKKFNKVSMMAKLLVGILIFSFVFTFPRYIQNKVVYDEETLRYISLEKDWNNQVFDIVYTLILYYMIIYIVPLLFLTYATIRLIIVLRRNRQMRQEMTMHRKRQEDLTLSLVAVVIVFLVCQLMNPLRRLIAELIPDSEKECGHAYYYFSDISSTFVIFNSFVNFIIYSICSKRFGEKIKRILFSAFCNQNLIAENNTETGEEDTTKRTARVSVNFKARNKVAPAQMDTFSNREIAFVTNFSIEAAREGPSEEDIL